MRFFKSSFIILAALFLTACAIVPGGEVYISDADRKMSDETPSITLEQIEFHKITPANTMARKVKRRQPHRNAKLERQVKNYAYKVGAGDILQVTVWEHPELLNLGAEGLPAIGFLIDSQGNIFYPYVGRMHVAGQSIYTIRDQLSESLAKYIENPQLDVTVTTFASKKIYLTGEIARPAPLVMQGRAITLLDAITQAGGVTANADMNDIVVVRKAKRRHIDLYAMMHYGDMRQNILLIDGDQIHIASQKPKYAYVMGQVAAPLTIAVSPEGTTLAEALGRAHGINEQSADASAIYVIRDSQVKGKVAKVYMLDLSNMAAMVLASKFEILSEDVVYIAKSPIVKWNQLLSVVNPTLGLPSTLNSTKASVQSIFN
ncbi:MAG: polysaccharide biosynthesis/export family protein [OCS116 cluster bacterium]|nr:polysaccharide biosynthesis/export family protein [OCS116 cluster bacterium]